MLLRVALLLAAALLAAPARSAEVEEMSAALLESSTTSGKLVLFYDGGAASARALAVLAQLAAEDAVRGLQYIKVDSRSEMNADAVREAEFGAPARNGWRAVPGGSARRVEVGRTRNGMVSP